MRWGRSRPITIRISLQISACVKVGSEIPQSLEVLMVQRRGGIPGFECFRQNSGLNGRSDPGYHHQNGALYTGGQSGRRSGHQMRAPEIGGPWKTGTSTTTAKRLAKVIPATIVQLEIVAEAVRRLTQVSLCHHKC